MAADIRHHPSAPGRSRRWTIAAVAGTIAVGLGGCAVVTVAGAAAGAAIEVTGAVVSTAVSVTGKVVGKTIDAVTPGDGDKAAPAKK